MKLQVFHHHQGPALVLVALICRMPAEASNRSMLPRVERDFSRSPGAQRPQWALLAVLLIEHRAQAGMDTL